MPAESLFLMGVALALFGVAASLGLVGIAMAVASLGLVWWRKYRPLSLAILLGGLPGMAVGGIAGYALLLRVFADPGSCPPRIAWNAPVRIALAAALWAGYAITATIAAIVVAREQGRDKGRAGRRALDERGRRSLVRPPSAK